MTGRRGEAALRTEDGKISLFFAVLEHTDANVSPSYQLTSASIT